VSALDTTATRASRAIASVLIAVAPPGPRAAGGGHAAGPRRPDWDHPGAPLYVLYRSLVSGGPYSLLAETPERAFTDTTAELNVEHFYVVVAKDDLGNPSPTSNEASATPRRTEPPATPVILFPTDAAHPITLRSSRTDVRGRTDPDTEVTLLVNGLARPPVPALGLFAEQGQTPVPEHSGTYLLSPDGRRLAYALADLATGNARVEVRQLAGSLPARPGDYAYVYPVAFAPDGERLLVFSNGLSADGTHYRSDLHVYDLDTGERTPLEEGTDYAFDAAWSPDGTRVAYVTATDATSCRLVFLDLATGLSTSPAHGAGCPYDPSFSPDGERLAFRAWAGQWEGRLLQVATGALTTFDTGLEDAPLWSPSGDDAYGWGPILAHPPLRRRCRKPPRPDGRHPGQQPARLRSRGRWLSYASDTPLGTRLIAHDLASDEVVDLGPYHYDLASWTRGGFLGAIDQGTFSVRPGFAGSFEVKDVPLEIGENQLVARAEDTRSGLSSADSLPVTVTVPAEGFPDLAVTAADVFASPLVPAVGNRPARGASTTGAGGGRGRGRPPGAGQRRRRHPWTPS
jgi:hypothetical protein